MKNIKTTTILCVLFIYVGTLSAQLVEGYRYAILESMIPAKEVLYFQELSDFHSVPLYSVVDGKEVEWIRNMTYGSDWPYVTEFYDNSYPNNVHPYNIPLSKKVFALIEENDYNKAMRKYNRYSLRSSKIDGKDTWLSNLRKKLIWKRYRSFILKIT